MILHEASHTDHVSPGVLKFVMEKFADRGEFFIETVELPAGLNAQCNLHGPALGDPPVPEDEVAYLQRNGRQWESRTVARFPRLIRTVTVVGGPYEDYACVLYTVYGGPPAPQEPNDPNLKDEKRAESEAFWKEHALS